MDYVYRFYGLYKYFTSYSRVCLNCEKSFYSQINDAEFCCDGCGMSFHSQQQNNNDVVLTVTPPSTNGSASSSSNTITIETASMIQQSHACPSGHPGLCGPLCSYGPRHSHDDIFV